MKIRVQRRDGDIETLTLVPPVETHDKPYDVPDGVKMLTKFKCGDGMEHFFTEDGYYDGWGRAVLIPFTDLNTMPQEASDIVESVEADRQIDPAIGGVGN